MKKSLTILCAILWFCTPSAWGRDFFSRVPSEEVMAWAQDVEKLSASASTPDYYAYRRLSLDNKILEWVKKGENFLPVLEALSRLFAKGGYYLRDQILEDLL